MLINCDLGESFGNWKTNADAQVMPYIHMANIACGFHAGDPAIMVETVALAKEHGVQIGAHPSYPDLQGFGRRSLTMSRSEIEACLLYQLGALQGICDSQQVELGYVKPHGALYHDILSNPDLYLGVLSAIKKFNSDLSLVILSTQEAGELIEAAETFGINLLFEAFADRAYDDNGGLVSRSQPGAVLQNIDAVIQQMLSLKQRQTVTTITGKTITIKADTLCVHGDNELAVGHIQQIKEAFDRCG